MAEPKNADANWSLFCRAMLANTDYIFGQSPNPSLDTEKAQAHTELLLATRANLLVAACEIGVRYNNLRPASCLPAELLCIIFSLVASEQQPVRCNVGTGKPGDLGWIAISHVCRRWRSVLLDMPSLWASCVCIFPVAMADMVARAQRAPLTLDLDFRKLRPSRFPAHFHAALSYVRLASTIRFVVPVASQSIITYVFTTYDLPSTEDLELEVVVVREDRDVPAPMFQCDSAPLQAPLLRRCSLKQLFIPWNTTEITRLEIARDMIYTPSQAALIPSPELFLNVLSKCPSLRYLHVEGWVPDCTPLLSDATAHRVKLHYLEELSLLATGNRCEHLWRLLEIPSSALLRFDITFEQQLDPPPIVYSLMGSLYPHIHADLRDQSEPAPLGLLVHIEEEVDYQLHIYSLSQSTSTSPPCNRDSGPFSSYRPRLSIKLNYAKDLSWVDGVPAMLKMCGISCEAVGSIGVRPKRLQPGTVWQDFFRPFIRAHTLWISSFNIDDEPQTGIISALAMEDVKSRTQGNSGVVLPQMRKLWMRDLVLEDPQGASGRHRASFQEKVLDAIRWRAMNGLESFRVSRIPTDVDEQVELCAALKEDFIARASTLVPFDWDRARERRVALYDYNDRISWRFQ